MGPAEHLDRGREYYDEGRYEEAAREFGKAIELSPAFAEAYTGRGYAYQR
jgi:Flp pilus assembly protein TadD